MDKAALERLVRKVLLEQLGETPRGVRRLCPGAVKFADNDLLDTGRRGDRVYTRDLLSLAESPRLGVGVMEVENTRFPWTLNYDEVDCVLEGELEIVSEGRHICAGPGEAIFIPKGSAIEFASKGKTRFLYVTYPADWQNQG